MITIDLLINMNIYSLDQVPAEKIEQEVFYEMS